MSEIKTTAMKRFFSRYKNLITIHIGSKPIEFQVHEDVLTQSSDFFRKACSGPFAEATSKIIRLPEMDLASFTSYIHWAYTGSVKVRDDPDDDEALASATKSGNKPGRGVIGDIKLCLIKLYIAADMLMDKRLRNAAIDRLMSMCILANSTPGSQLVTLAYESTPEGSKLRQWFIDAYSDFGDMQWWKENGQELPKAFLFDVLFCKMAVIPKVHVRNSVAVKRHEECKYHEHDEEVPKCVKG